MGASLNTRIRVNVQGSRVTNTGLHYTPAVVGACLFLLLLFSTFTVFVKQAWALQSFQIGIYVLLAGYLLWSIRRGGELAAGGLTPCLIYIIPLWGLLQIVAHTTVSSYETRLEILKWGALAGVLFLSQTVARSSKARRHFVSAILAAATCFAVLCLTQLFTSQGRVLWIFDSGYPDVYATFPNHNNYAQLVELALPIALWRALREGFKSWWYPLSGGVLYASVIGSASRSGALISTAELLGVLIIGLIQLRAFKTLLHARTTLAILVAVPVVATVFTVAVGSQNVWHRFEARDPFSGRKQFLVAAIHMAEHKPLTGFGLGTFPEVYQQFAIQDFPFYANHAHNDWAEFAADGGVPFLLLVLIPFALAIPTAIRHPWGLGLIAVMAHACVDYPFPRPAVSGWMFALLGALYMARAADKALLRSDAAPN
ncbi:MAG: O-antigen ligase family protein [Terracidiphilus sp.]|jgi:O-antigen ligase